MGQNSATKWSHVSQDSLAADDLPGIITRMVGPQWPDQITRCSSEHHHQSEAVLDGTQAMTTATITLSVRRLVRSAAQAHANCPVVVIDGNQAPDLRGRSYYWTTMSGKTEIRHPNAYGWPCLYHRSTLRVVVGAEWLAQQLAPVAQQIAA